uniref:Uncharacterized protein n=1 Tax=Avena sativa TaxID=4498 RepID=A0ACD6ABA5_AVESA
MELASAFLGTIGPKIYNFLQENRNLQFKLEHDVGVLKIEVEIIAAAIRDDELRGGTQVDRVWVGQVRDFAHSIEDCIDRFTRCLADASRVQRLKMLLSRREFAAEIRKLRKRSGEISNLRNSYSTSSESSTRMGMATSVPVSIQTYTPSADLVGMGLPRDELLELIRENQGEAKQLKVVSVCGFGGLGKTRLAREVYRNEAIVGLYEPRLWVPAADKDAADVLKAIHEELGISSSTAPKSYDDVGKLSTSIRDCLDSKRFFIVIDDMGTEFWNIIKSAFPAAKGVSSRIVVTTAIQHIATACSSSDGHVYAMRPLDKQHSRQLFLKAAFLEDPAPNVRLGSEALKKCDGLPLALVTTAQFLQSRCDPTLAEWAKLCGNLGEHLETEDTLARMKHVLLHSYTSLPHDHLLKAFLLYLGIFPCGHPVRTDRLIRRWLAEEFIVGGDGGRGPLDVATDNFKKLVDRCIIQPIDISNNKQVKTWQTHGMMLEFILHKSTRENFITLLRGQACSPSKIRWLSLYHNTGNSYGDLSLVRSMTIFGKAHESVLEFSKCELLRLLDLEECDNQLEDKHLREICKLLLLRYLSLRGSITVLPKDIAKLKLLATLDVRRTEIKVLPIEVIELPCLVHLFGKFKLADVGRRMIKLQKFLSEKSKLETLEGFVADEGFAKLMDHMNNLTKVEIWCESDVDATIVGHLSKSIKGFIQRGTNENEDRSLSLNFHECSKGLLNFSLENSCYLSKLSLQGNILSLPPFVTEMDGVTELCLSSSNQLNDDILTDLIKVRSLLYLKDEWTGSK